MIEDSLPLLSHGIRDENVSSVSSVLATVDCAVAKYTSVTARVMLSDEPCKQTFDVATLDQADFRPGRRLLTTTSQAIDCGSEVSRKPRRRQPGFVQHPVDPSQADLRL